jgi:hypothetical protein
MHVVLAWAAVLVVFVAPYPASVWVLSYSSHPPSRWLTLIVTIGLGIGILTWLMMLEGMLNIPFQIWTILLPYLIVFALITLLAWRRRKPKIEVNARPFSTTQSPYLVVIGTLVATLVSLAILLNAVYWPFYKADALGIYADQAHYLYSTRSLIPLDAGSHSYYEAYPMLVQFAYTYTYLASGWENPYLAKMIPTLLGLACLIAVFYLGKAVYDEKTGWVAMLLFVLTPLFGRWASSGYADLPMAFYYTLAVLFAWRTCNSNNIIDTLISGAAIGFGAWTKNAMLPAAVFWLGFMLLALVRKQIGIKTILIACIACWIVAVPWYIRNLLEAHLLMPATVWTNQAAPNLSNLLVFITHPENFGLTGWLIVMGILLSLLQFVCKPRSSGREKMLLIFTLPYFAFWWLLASYDRRFLLYFLTILVVLAAHYSLEVWKKISQHHQSFIRWIIITSTLILTIYIASISIDYKTEMLRDPFMDNIAKHNVITAINR